MNYTISQKIGAGSFGVVYRGRDQASRRCAIKLAEAKDPVATGLLQAQFQMLAELRHKRIVAVLDFDLHSPRGPMLVMELVEGLNLGAFVSSHSDSELVTITLQILDALRYLHGRGRLHGDLKPDSIIVVGDGAELDIKLVDAGLDFGEASRLPELAGTLPYLAPEIIRNLPADGRSDLYSLGVTLYEVLTGTCPFRGSTAAEILTEHLEVIPPEPTSIKPTIAPQWNIFIAGLIKKEPFARYRDATQAALELGKLFGQRTAAAVHFVPPSDLGLAGLEAEARRVRDFVAAGPAGGGEPLVICGRRGSGVERLTAVGEVAGKVGGSRVSRMSLKPGMPALAQVVEVLRASVVPGGARARGAQVTGRAGGEASPDRSAGYAEIIEILKRDGKSGPGHLVILDGCEAIEASELEALRKAASLAGKQARMILGYHTEDPAPGRALGATGAELIETGPLSAEAVEALLKSHFGVPALPEGLSEHMHRATRGNRRELEVAVARLWKLRGLAYAVQGDLVGLTWDRRIAVPASPGEMLQEVLAELDPLEAEIIGLVAANGGELAVRAIREYYSPRDCAHALANLLDEALLERVEGPTTVRLSRDGLSEAILRAMGAEWIKTSSERLASILESDVRNEGEWYGLGLLHLKAGEGGRACAAFQRAGDYYARFSPGDAALAYSEALKCAPAGAPSAELARKLGEVRLARGDLNGALAAFEQGSAIEPSLRRNVGWVRGLRGDLEDAAQILRESEQTAAARGDLADRARVLSDLGHIYGLEGKRDLALACLREAKSFFGQAGLEFEAGLATYRMAIVMIRTGGVAAATAAWEEARGLFERAGARHHVGLSLMALATCYRRQMDFARAARLFEDALAAFEATKSLASKATCLQNHALMLVDTGDLELAGRLAQEAMELHALLGDQPSVILTRLVLTAVDLEAGN
ncbi:MAG TPA: protein kinase, partial [bacterium]|nr:protein kinase [bacterium]